MQFTEEEKSSRQKKSKRLFFFKKSDLKFQWMQNFSLYLIGETNAYAKEDAAEDEHEDIHSATIDRRADQERDAPTKHGPFSPKDPRNNAGKEGSNQRRKVQRRSEHRQQLWIKLTVLVCALVRLLLLVNAWEEL